MPASFSIDMFFFLNFLLAFDLLYFAEIVSSAKRALARVLVIIVSIGFGIVRWVLFYCMFTILCNVSLCKKCMKWNLVWLS